MSLNDHIPDHQMIKENLALAREQLFAALDRYAQVCSNIRNTHHQTFSTAQFAGYPSSELASELLYLPVLEARLQDATRNLNRAYELGCARTSPAYPPAIDRLPDEILAQVFSLIVAAEPRDLHPTGKNGAVSFPSYPDFLAQTCARWRQVALALFPLWTHIYLGSHPINFGSILDRARSYVQRAGHLPVELHITDLGDQLDPYPSPTINSLQQLLSSIAHRTTSIEIVRSSPTATHIETEALACILRGCSDMFTSLAIRSKGLLRPSFIRPLNLDDFWGPGVIEVDLSHEHIERGFSHLTVLHASQIYPRWTSTAYHGLVDLRLISNHTYTYECPTIYRDEFIAILLASPRLQVLHFGIHLAFEPDSSVPNICVPLDDLEVLSLTASGLYSPEDTEYEIERALRHIAPGSKPLSLTLDLDRYHDPDPLATIKAFFYRSRVVKFCAKRGNPPPVKLLYYAAHLTELVFDHCHYGAVYDFVPVRSRKTKLDSWIIRDSCIYVEDLELLVKQYPTKSTIISNCRLFSKDDAFVEIVEDDFGGPNSNYRLPKQVRYLKPGQSLDSADWYNL